MENGRLTGLVTVYEMQTVPISLWPWRQIGQVMRPVSPSMIVGPDASIMDAMEQMAREGWDRLVVMQGDQVVGLVTHSAILHFLQLRQTPTP